MRILLSITFSFFAFLLVAQNTAIEFDGSSEYMTVAHKDNQNISDGFTIEAWIFANNWTTEVWRGSIISKDNQGPDRGYAFRVGDNGRLSFVIAVDNAWEEVISPALMNEKQWHHIAGVVNNKVVKLYIDGQEVASGSYAGETSALPQDLRIGASVGFGGRFFDGVIDEIRIWQTARTSQEIADNNTVDLTGTEAGLVLYLPMNEGSGSVATNSVDAACSATGVGLDDGNWVNGYILPDFDLSMQSILGVDRVAMLTRPVKLRVEVQNVGTMDMQSYDIVVLIDGVEVFTETQSYLLAGGDKATFQLGTPIDLSPYVDPEIEVVVQHPNDSNSLNDAASTTIINSGDFVNLFKQQAHNFGGDGQNHFNNVVLPSDLAEYSKLLLHITLECPNGGCDPWDQPAKVIAMTDEGNFEIARYITPYGIACDTWTVDVTDFKNILQGENTYNSYVQVWGPSGWLVTLDLELVIGDDPLPFKNLSTLWSDDYVVYGDPGISHDLEEVGLVVEPNTESSHVRMQITGHGQGNTNNAAEFYNVTHDFMLNGNLLEQHNLWNSNCGSNSCNNQAGNWPPNRAGWCPGQAVTPREFDTSNDANPGETIAFDYVLQDYTNSLNTGYNSSGHTEPHYRLHGFFVEESSQRFEQYNNVLIESIDPVMVDNQLESVSGTIRNNGTEDISNLSMSWYLNGDRIAAPEQLSIVLAPGESYVHDFTEITAQLINGTNVFFGEVNYALDQNDGDNYIKSDAFITVGTNDLEEGISFEIVPNPSNSNIHLTIDQGFLNGEIQVVDLSGRGLRTEKITDLNSTIRVPSVGTYFVRLISTTGNILTKKAVVIE